jgi:crotonobetainyl-CoA:carnitine CoA-transferase CaiB-like acyl-CoA transferase
MVCVGNPRLWANFCRAIERDDLVGDARFATNEQRLRHRPALVDEIERVLRAMSVDETVERFDAHHVPCGRVRTVADALNDPQLHARDMIVTMPHEELGTVTVIGNPIKLSRTPVSYRVPPPRLGEHTAEVLRSLDYSEDEVEQILQATNGRSGVRAAANS